MSEFKPKSSSISQNNTYEDCIRKWGFSSIDYLPQTPNISTSKGSALHDQIEIFLDVDENGMSRRTGKEPQMFPPGWELQYDFFKKNVIFKLNSEEQSMINPVNAKNKKRTYEWRGRGPFRKQYFKIFDQELQGSKPCNLNRGIL